MGLTKKGTYLMVIFWDRQWHSVPACVGFQEGANSRIRLEFGEAWAFWPARVLPKQQLFWRTARY